jgi:hypothetical protein
MIYKKEYSFYIAIVLIGIFTLSAFQIHFEYIDYSNRMLEKDPTGMIMGQYQYKASPWLSVGIFSPPLLAAVFLFDFIGITDEICYSALSPLTRSGRKQLLLSAQKKLSEGKADLNAWRSSRRKDPKSPKSHTTIHDKFS